MSRERSSSSTQGREPSPSLRQVEETEVEAEAPPPPKREPSIASESASSYSERSRSRQRNRTHRRRHRKPAKLPKLPEQEQKLEEDPARPVKFSFQKETAPKGQGETSSKAEPKRDALKLRLDLDLDVDIQLKAKIHGSVTLSLLLAAGSTFQPSGVPFKSPVTLAPGLEAAVLFSNLTTPRGITFDSASNLLVVERGFGITAFTNVQTPSQGVVRSVVISNPSFTQGIQVDGSELYASTAGQTFLFNYDPTTKTVKGPGQLIIDGIPPDGDLTTHTLQLTSASSPLGKGILVAVGPLTNIDITARDPSSGRSQVRFFPLTNKVTQNFLDGKLIAYGIRNPAGFAFSPFDSSLSTLYVVENGASIDNVTGLTPAFVNDNPADELERVDLRTAAVSYGFPDCTTLWNGTADPKGDPQYTKLKRGTQISLKLEEGRDDAWCQKIVNNHPPALPLAAHTVPLDIKFIPKAVRPSTKSFPSSVVGDAVVALHGSFDRTPPTGYGVIHVPFNKGNPAGFEYIIQAASLTTCPGSCIRPVGLAFGPDGRLYVSSDSSGELFVIERSG